MLAHFTILSLATASILLAHNVQTKAEDLALKDAVSMAGMQLFLNSGAPGLIIAVVQGDKSIIQAYGETAPPAAMSSRTRIRFSVLPPFPRFLPVMCWRRSPPKANSN
ncbi:hypothetical protein Q644_22935 [Brucella intermedia 229E]|uniref:Uncharacterized protein n=1 Tax=Brucella intermedia 229E TaxID=1337887 RepID=U4V818_9HYPH|nr:hypothetical protein Q644_22935 [Brucella intermedia 229E]